MNENNNADLKTIADFGLEWASFNQSVLPNKEAKQLFDSYFRLLPQQLINETSRGFDLGCGSGRWAKFVAQKVSELYCIDPSETALNVAKNNLKEFNNIVFVKTSVDNMPMEDNSMDFGYSLGVLHHIPNTQKGINSCVAKLKPGAPFLLYLYYALENKPKWFRCVWQISNLIRKIISRLPYKIKYVISQLIAILIYYPLAKTSLLLEKFGYKANNMPLYSYRCRSLYGMRTDALDRFGTRLEHRFTAKQIKEMMEKAGLEKITFDDSIPYWKAIGYKKPLT